MAPQQLLALSGNRRSPGEDLYAVKFLCIVSIKRPAFQIALRSWPSCVRKERPDDRRWTPLTRSLDRDGFE
jgi:hypothetical protein